MKHIFTLTLIAFLMSARAQINLEHNFEVYNLESATFTNANAGQKLFTNTEQQGFYSHPDTITIYNSDYSIYKTIALPVNYTYVDFYTFSAANAPSLSDQLFNSDTLLEFLAVQESNSGSNIYSVLNETGQVVFTFPDTLYGGVSLCKVGNAFKMVSVVGGNGGVTAHRVYTLPGSIPCNQCNGYISGIEDPGSTANKIGFNAYPNPFSNALNITYSLPYAQQAKIVVTDIEGRELLNMPVSKKSDNLSISTITLPKGVIILTLYSSNGNAVSKKMIKMD